MRQTALQNRGVTLVEVLIALTVLLIVFLGMIQTSIVVIQTNMRNLLRDEAVNITADEMARVRTADYDDLDGDGTADPTPVFVFNRVENRNYRQNITVPFGLQVRAEQLDPAGTQANKQITITTTWSWQGEGFQHQILTTRQR